jgi:hypothetical protein
MTLTAGCIENAVPPVPPVGVLVNCSAAAVPDVTSNAALLTVSAPAVATSW